MTQDEELDLTVAVLAPCGHKPQQAANDHVDDGEQHRRILRERRLRAEPAFSTPSRYSALFKLEHVSGAWLGDMLARLQVRYLEVQVVFADSRKFAEEWCYRFLAAALADSIGSDVAK